MRRWLGYAGRPDAEIDLEEHVREHAEAEDPESPEEPQWFERPAEVER